MKGGLKIMGKVVGQINDATKVFIAILILGLVGLLFLIVFGNLTDNLGFAANSQGANDTNAVITKLSGGAATFFTFSNVWFTLLAVVVLIIIVFSVIAVVRTTGGKGGFSS